jgi:AcrR family transcriptional regulator
VPDGTAHDTKRSTADRILAAVRTRLVADGYAGLSTRKVAAEAGVPLSQVHYHFGSKGGAVLALLAAENDRRLARQRAMYATDMPLWRRYEQACDYLEDDLESGYVRVLQEMIAAGWSNPEIAASVRDMLAGWFEVLTEVAAEAGRRLGSLGPFTAEEMAALIGNVFLGSEAMLLLDFGRSDLPLRSALRRIGAVIRAAEEVATATPDEATADPGARP